MIFLLPIHDMCLGLHAAFAQVAHRSGAVKKHIVNIMRDMGEVRVLANDSSSSDLLDFELTLLTTVS